MRAKTSLKRRFYISSRNLCAEAFGETVLNQCAIDSFLHWLLDVTFKRDRLRLRAGHEATNAYRIEPRYWRQNYRTWFSLLAGIQRLKSRRIGSSAN
jgi:predicted transposase YbfD/YdcC